MKPGRRLICLWLVSLTMVAAQPPAESALGLNDLVRLAKVLPAADLIAAARARGLQDPMTPAIARWLQRHGLNGELTTALAVLAHPTFTTTRWQPLAGSGFSLVLPVDWKLEEDRGALRVTGHAPPRTVTCAIDFRTWAFAADGRLGRLPKTQVLADLLPAQAKPFEDKGLEARYTRPVAARGITGVHQRLTRTRIGEPAVTVDLAVFQHGGHALLIRSYVAGPADDTFVKGIQPMIDAVLRGVIPSESFTWHDADDRVRVLARTAEGLRFIDRSGAAHTPPTRLPVFALKGEALGRFVAWQTDRWIISGPNGTSEAKGDHGGNQQDAVLNSSGTFTPAGSAVTPARPAIRPARTLEVIADPGSRHLLCAVASDHFPVPGRSGTAESVGRLTYVLATEDEPPRDLLIRTRPGADQPVLRSPRFLPSGMEILFIDPERGLCVIPRDGGLPVVLLAGEISEAEAWLAPKR